MQVDPSHIKVCQATFAYLSIFIVLEARGDYAAKPRFEHHLLTAPKPGLAAELRGVFWEGASLVLDL